MEKAKILIVEDEMIVARDLMKVLEGLGYVVPTIVSSGAEAVDRVAELQPDVVLMDIMLKGDMDGVKAAEEIRRRFHVPVIYVTAYADEDTMQRAKITEPYGYILKPFRNRELSTTIEMALYKHRAEEELQRSEERYRVLVNNVNGVIIVAQDGVIKFANSRVGEITGYSRDEILNTPFIDFIHPDDRDMIMQRYQKRLGGEEIPATYPVRIIDRSGSTRWIETNSVLINWEGKPAIMSFLTDVTDRMIAEDELRESRRKYQSLYSSMNEGVCLHEVIYDESGKVVDYKILDVNPAYESILGISREEAIGRMASDLYKAGEPPYIKIYAETANTGQPASFETYFPPMNKHFRISVFSPGKNQFATIFSDITERRQMEEELIKIQKLESLGILAGGIAHDFNNLLTGIMGNISLAQMYVETGRPSSMIIERLVAADKASMRAKAVAQQLLTFARGGAPVKKATVIGNLLRETASLATLGSSVRCEFLILDDLHPAEADEAQISQVIRNMVINAVEAMPDGGVLKVYAENTVVEAKHHLPLEPGEYIKVSIQDQGVGIPQEHLQKIFDPYFTTKETGSGLGLAVCYSIIEKHGGCIEVDSRKGHGTTLHIYLPASLGEGVAGRESVEKQHPAGKGRVLLMDDAAIIRELASEMLISQGYRVTTAVDGVQTVQLYTDAMKSGDPFDVVVVGLTTPGGMGGKETIQRLQAADPEVRAVVSSGYPNDPVMDYFQQYGFKAAIAKPYSMQELCSVLHKAMLGNANNDLC